MLHIDRSKCINCGACIRVCPQKAITMKDGLPMINERICTGCGICSSLCPVDAIREAVPAGELLKEGEETMQYGYGRGFGTGLGNRGGAGLGFRGSSPPWPYTGRGRGGLPRCWYPGAAIASQYQPVQPHHDDQLSREGEIDELKRQVQMMRSHLEQIESRIKQFDGNQ
ncbi:MAG TPA: 4Fe-4S binding protein [Dehalococcoidia bacterium]|nr:4Fe-4S binding protein [Dehalococcoidia bacterium]